MHCTTLWGMRLRNYHPAAVQDLPAPCLHVRAVKVDSAFDATLIYRCWCPDCETGLPANFRVACCGGEPGTTAVRHAYNCPRLEVTL